MKGGLNMFIDPDKKVAKTQKERPGIYQSTKHPEHFENEGEEYSDVDIENKSMGQNIPDSNDPGKDDQSKSK